MTTSLEMAKMESLLIDNKKFAKQWHKNLKRHKNDCPCKLNGYTNINISSNKDNKNKNESYPFDLRQYGKSCFSCVFARILQSRKLKYYHLLYIIKVVLG